MSKVSRPQGVSEGEQPSFLEGSWETHCSSWWQNGFQGVSCIISQVAHTTLGELGNSLNIRDLLKGSLPSGTWPVTGVAEDGHYTAPASGKSPWGSLEQQAHS